MPQTMIRPAEGRRVRRPDGSLLPPEGAPADLSDLYWQRRLAEGDVEPVPEAAPPAAEGE